MKLIRLIPAFTLVMLFACGPTWVMSAEVTRTLVVSKTAEKASRVAIVLGNSAYPSGALANPQNDATAIAASLKKIGFDVDLILNASKSGMDAAFKQFSQKAETAQVALLFYAGHGVQVNGNNYIVPIDANPRSERDLKREMVRIDDVVDDMGNAKVKLIFFDACRDNPLSRSFSRSGSRGMAAPLEATGTLISFATKHGNTAADGDGRHSPYTQALLSELDSPGGMEIEQMLRKVQQNVKKATQGQQEPWRYGSLDGDFYFKPPLPRETNERLMQAAVLQATEQANRERAELQRSLENVLKEQETKDRLSQEALKRANEQAARERAEFQQSMEKMLKEALARQNAVLEAERATRMARESSREQANPPVPSLPSSVPVARAEVFKPLQIASIDPAMSQLSTPRPVNKVLAAISSAAGDEWEYLAKDTFGKSNKVMARVKAVVPGSGVLEEYLLDDKPVGEWVFDGKPTMLGLPIDTTVLMAPYWSGKDIKGLALLNGSRCSRDWSCRVMGNMAGKETITVPAGTFETQKLDIDLNFWTGNGRGLVRIAAWYSEEHQRLIKQTVYFNGNFTKLNETVELTAYRFSSR